MPIKPANRRPGRAKVRYRARGFLRLLVAPRRREPTHRSGLRRLSSRSRAARRSVAVAGATVRSGWCGRSDHRCAVGLLHLGHPASEGRRLRPHRSRQWRSRGNRDRPPGADGIDYWLLSSEAPFTTWIVGGEWFLHPSVRIGPTSSSSPTRMTPIRSRFQAAIGTLFSGSLTFYWSSAIQSATTVRL